MTWQLKRLDDPRDPLSKARRSELLRYAQANGIPNVDGRTPARLLRRLLRAQGLTRPPIPNRTLGFPDKPANGQPEPVASGDTLDAEDAFLAAYQEQEKAKEPAKAPVKLRDMPEPETSLRDQWEDGTPYTEMKIYTLRRMAKRRGIKSSNTWKTADFIAALEAQDEPHTA